MSDQLNNYLKSDLVTLTPIANKIVTAFSIRYNYVTFIYNNDKVGKNTKSLLHFNFWNCLNWKKKNLSIQTVLLVNPK